MFVSRSSLWTDLCSADPDKTRVYLERSKSSPIDLSLSLPLSDPFSELIPRAIGRLRFLCINAGGGDLEDIIAHLSRPAPLLEELSIGNVQDPKLISALFNGDLSSLRGLYLEEVCTELPWRNMVNLTMLMLVRMSPLSVKQVLDFFEGAPHLREVDLYSTTPLSGAQPDRLVSLPYLERMDSRGHPSSHLFDHLLIPVGARLTVCVDLTTPPIGGHPPRFIDNLRNFSNFTTIKLDCGPTRIQFSGPNGEVRMDLRDDRTYMALESLAHFNTSKTEQLEIVGSDPPSCDPPHRAFLPMKNLRTLTLVRCKNPHFFVHALDPGMSLSGVVVCPKLEELVIEHREMFDIRSVTGTAAARASKGVGFKIVRIVPWRKVVHPQLDVLELEKYVRHVECEVDKAADGISDADEEGRGNEGGV